MSLINEALKKAQRARVEDQAPAAPAPATAGAAPVPRRGKAHSANTMVLFGVAAVILVILSIVGTFYFMKRGSGAAPVVAAPNIKPAAATPPSPATPSATEPKPIAAAPAPGAATPSVVAPATPPAVTAPAPATIIPAPIETAPPVASAPASPPPGPVVPAQPEPTPIAAAAPPPLPTAPLPPPVAATPAAAAKPDPRVGAYVDSIRVTGIRSSGNDSRVLMNERVYRVNDIVERTLGVRLIKVANDSLTFSDANGVTYVKHF